MGDKKKAKRPERACKKDGPGSWVCLAGKTITLTGPDVRLGKLAPAQRLQHHIVKVTRAKDKTTAIFTSAKAARTFFYGCWNGELAAIDDGSDTGWDSPDMSSLADQLGCALV